MRIVGGQQDMDVLSQAVSAGVEIFDLGRLLSNGTPHSMHHPGFGLVLPRRHGDRVRPDGSSGANDLIFTGSHVGTHIDALCHISYCGRMFGGVDVESAQTPEGFTELGAETLEPIVARGLLLDVPAACGFDCCSADHEVTVTELESALSLTGTRPAPGDVLLVRTGWGRYFDSHETFAGVETGTPGPGVEAARWLANFSPRAVGGETIPFEWHPPESVPFELPAHRLLLVERGIPIIEMIDVEPLVQAERYVFTFVLSPLKMAGATASPVRPLAVVAKGALGNESNGSRAVAVP